MTKESKGLEMNISYKFRQIFYYEKWIMGGVWFLTALLVQNFIRIITVQEFYIIIGITAPIHIFIYMMKRSEDNREEKYYERRAEERKARENLQ